MCFNKNTEDILKFFRIFLTLKSLIFGKCFNQEITYSSFNFILIIGMSDAWNTALTSPVSRNIIFPLLLPTITLSWLNQQQAVYVMLSILLYPNCLQVKSWHPRHLRTESPTKAIWLASLILQAIWEISKYLVFMVIKWNNYS